LPVNLPEAEVNYTG